MNDEQYGERYTDLVRLYRANPKAFSEDDLDQIEYLGKTLGRRFTRNQEQSEENISQSIGGVLSQFALGVGSGFTTIPMGEDPDNIAEAIARSSGQLLGFIGIIPGAGTLTRLTTVNSAKILGKVAGLGTGKIASGAARLQKGFKTLDPIVSQPLAGKSFPLVIGDAVLKQYKNYVHPVYKNKALKYFSEGVQDKIIDATDTAVKFGAASFISSWSGGIDAMLKGGLMGAAEGGVFRGISNFTELGKMLAKGGVSAKQANLALRTISSSLYGGGLSASLGDPIELQIYHYLLGAYFGITDTPLTQRNAINFINKTRQQTEAETGYPLTDRMLDPELNPGFKDLRKEEQELVRDQMQFQFGARGDASGIIADAFRGVLDESPQTREAFRREYAKAVIEEQLDKGIDVDEAYAIAGKTIKNKGISDLILEEQFQDVLKTRFKIQYGNTESTNKSNELVIRQGFEDHEINTTLRDPLAMWAEDAIPGTVDDTGLKKFVDIGRDIEKSVAKKYSVDRTLKEIEIKFDVEISKAPKESTRLLRQAIKKISQNQNIDQISYNRGARLEIDKFKPVAGQLSDLRRVPEVKSKSHFQKTIESFGRRMIASKYSDDGRGKVNNLFETFFETRGNLINPVAGEYLSVSAKIGKPFTFGKKDSGVLYHADGWFFDDTNDAWVASLQSKLDAINQADSDLKIKLAPGKINQKYQYNNILLLERLNGLPLEVMAKANKDGSGSFVLSPEDINKRMQPIADGNYTLSPGIGKLRGSIVSGTDAKDYLNQIDFNEVHTDGILLVKDDSFRGILEDSGLPEESGFAKFTVVGDEGDGNGMIVGKLGAFGADGSAQKFMEQNNIDFLFFDTAVKQRGLRPINNIDFTANGPVIREGQRLNVFNIDPKNVRVNFGVYEKMPEDARIPKQLLSSMTDKAARQALLDNHINPSIEGNADINKKIEDNTITQKEVQDLDVDDINVSNLYKILFQKDKTFVYGGPLYSKIWAKIFSPKDEHYIDALDTKGGADDLDSILPELNITDFNSSSDRILKVALKYGVLEPSIINREQVSSFAYEAFKRYVINRATRPKIKNSGMTFAFGNDSFLQHDLRKPIKRGQYMLAKEMRNFNIEWIDGTQMKMGKAWDLYQKETDATKKNQMKDIFDFIVIRVPQDSPSGARVLSFNGFTNRRGYGMHLNTVDMQYLGGADNDGDKMHFFQNLDKGAEGSPIKNAILKIKDEYDDGQGGVTDPKGGLQAAEKGTLSNALNPLSVLQNHLYTTFGNRMVGPSATIGPIATSAKKLYDAGIDGSNTIEITPTEASITFIDDVRNARQYETERTFKKTIVALDLKFKNSLKNLFSLRRQAMNAAVDATGRLPYNRNTIANKISLEAIDSYRLIDEDGVVYDSDAFGVGKFDKFINLNKINTSRGLKLINGTIDGRKFDPETRQKVVVKFDEFNNNLKDFDGQYGKQDLGTAYSDAVKRLSLAVKDNYKPVVEKSSTDKNSRRTVNEFLRYARVNTSTLFRIVNDFSRLHSSKDYASVLSNNPLKEYIQTLRASGQNIFAIGKREDDHNRTFKFAFEIERAVSNLATMQTNQATFEAAIAKGISEQKLGAIRKHVDKFKYNKNKFEATDKTDPSYIQNVVLNDNNLGIKSVKNIEGLEKFTENYKSKLKTKEEKDYYDSYMLGSLSQQRYSIDEIARYEYIIASKKANNYFEARQVSLDDSSYDKYTYDYLSSDDFRSVSEYNELLRVLPDRVLRIYQNKNNSLAGFSLPHVSDQNVANWITAYNNIIQANPKDKISSDLIDPRSSMILEQALIRGIDPNVKKEILDFIEKDFRDYRSRGNENFGDIQSVQDYVKRISANRPPIDENEARQSAVADEVISEGFAKDLLEKIITDTKSKVNYDPNTREGKRNLDLLDDLKAHISKHPSTVGENFNSIYEGYVKKELKMSTVDDLVTFTRFLNNLGKKTFLEKLLQTDPTKNVSRLYDFFFPDTLGELFKRYNPEISSKQIAQVLTVDGYKNKEVREVMSFYEKMRRALGGVEEATSATTSLLSEYQSGQFRFLNDDSVLSDRVNLNLVSLRIKEMQLVNDYKKRIQSAKDETDIENLEYNIELLESRYKEVEGIYNELKNKKYYIDHPETGKREMVTGEDLMGSISKGFVNHGIISRAYTKRNQTIDEGFIRPASGENFVTRNDDGSMDVNDTINKLIQQFEGTKLESERVANIGLSNMFEIARELEYLNNTRVVVNGQPTLIADIADVELRNKKLFEVRMNDRGVVEREGPDGPVYRRNPDGTFFLRPMIGKLPYESYVPHVNHSEEAIQEYVERFGEEKVDSGNGLSVKRWYTQGKLDDLGLSSDFIDALFSTKNYQSNRKGEVTIRKFGNLAGRSDRLLGGWETSESAYDQYVQGLNRAYHKTFGVILAQKYLRDFRKAKSMGDVTESWAKFAELYIQDFAGKPGSFGKEYFQDPYLNFKRRPYYYLSDQYAQKQWNRIVKRFGWEDKVMEKNEQGSLEFQERLKWFTRLEGKYQLLTLLTNTTSMTNNYTGGNAMTAVSTGLRPWLKASRWTYLRDNVDPSIDSAEKARKLAIEFGAIESMVASEVGPTKQLTAQGKSFMKEIVGVLKSDKKNYRKEVLDIARKYNMADVVSGSGAWLLSSVEMRLRTRSFWAHYIQARESMMVNSGAFRWDDPILIQQALKGVWGTQFLYNAANRPAIARTNLGRVWSRFQLWSWNSVRFRRDIVAEARRSGFQEGTQEYARFVRMAQADALMFALATLMPLSMFESIVPAPWNYLLDFSDYFFGDEEARDRAFFGTLPYPFNPVQAILPPSTRVLATPLTIPIEMAIAMISDKDMLDALDYRVVSLLPYGMLARNIIRSIDTPAMAPQYLTGIHFHSLTRLVNNMEDSATLKSLGLYEARSRFIDEEIKELTDFYTQK